MTDTADIVMGEPYQTIPGDIDRPAQRDIIVIGKAPGKTEMEQGRPFVGKSGQLLDEALAEMNVPRDSLYITNVYKTHPLNEQGATRAPTETEIAEHSHFLDYELLHVKPRWALLLGSTASRTILHVHNFGELRGQWHKNTMVAWHPGYVLRQGGLQCDVGQYWLNDLRMFFERAGAPFGTGSQYLQHA